MATFETQIEGLTGLSIDGSSNPTQTEVSQFLTDGAKDVINRISKLDPSKMPLFSTSATDSTNAGVAVDSGIVLDVVRADGVSATNLNPASKINSNLRYRVTNTQSLSYRSNFHPCYYLLDGKVYVVPSPSGTTINKAVVSYVSYPTIAFGDSSVTEFPVEYEYLLVIYASMKSLDNALSAKTFPDDVAFPVLPAGIILSTVSSSLPSFTEPAPFVAPVSLSDVDVSFSEVGAFPSFIKPTFTAPTLSSIGSMNLPVSPVAPSLPNITSPGVNLSVIGDFGTAPVYTQPKVGGIDEELTNTLTATTGSTFGTDADFLDVSKWFTTAGELLEDEEDTELAQAQLQKISTYIQAYGQSMQNALNKFNDANAEYQATIQKKIQQAQLDQQRASKEADLSVQTSIQDYTLELQKYQAEVGLYQIQVNNEVQRWTNEEWTQYFQKYSTDYGQLLAEYGQNIQAETARVQNESQDYQQKVSKALQKYQAETGYDTTKQNADLQIATQRFTQDLAKENASYQSELNIYTSETSKINQDNQSKLNKYSSEVQAYQADISSKLQDYSAKIQKVTTDYQWMQSRQQSLRQEYAQAFATMAPPAQQQQQQQRR